jgi:uncharacterized protein
MIDAHVHIFPAYRSTKAVQWIKRYIHRLEIPDSIDEGDITGRLARCGVSSFFNYVYPLHPKESESLNEFNAALSRRVHNVVCFGSLHPENENREEIVKRAILELDLIGLKFHPFVQRFDLLDPRMDVVYRTLELLGRPVVFHTGFERFYGAKLSPAEMETLLKRYPKLVVVISHMFYPRLDEAFRLVKEYENVYLDGTNVFSDYRESADGENIFEGFLVPEDGEQTYRVFFNHSMEDLERYSRRVMVGTDYPVSMNYPEAIYEHVVKLELSAGASENLWENTARDFVTRFKPDFYHQTDVRGPSV